MWHRCEPYDHVHGPLADVHIPYLLLGTATPLLPTMLPEFGCANLSDAALPAPPAAKNPVTQLVAFVLPEYVVTMSLCARVAHAPALVSIELRYTSIQYAQRSRSPRVAPPAGLPGSPPGLEPQAYVASKLASTASITWPDYWNLSAINVVCMYPKTPAMSRCMILVSRKPVPMVSMVSRLKKWPL